MNILYDKFCKNIPDLYLAKPNNITYKQHVFNVLLQYQLISDIRPLLQNKYKTFTSIDIDIIIFKIIYWHDNGKLDAIWQTACQLDSKIWYDNIKNQTQNKYKHLLRANFRHEIQSVIDYLNELKKNKTIISDDVKYMTITAILSHHGKLSRNKYHIDRFEKQSAIWLYNDVDNYFDTVFNGINKNNYTNYFTEFFKYTLPRTMLQYADVTASVIEANPSFDSLIRVPKFDMPFDKNTVQKMVENLDSDIVLLKAAVGSGKTYASIMWADNMINNLNKADRIVMLMPTRISSNGIYENLIKHFKNITVSHGSAKKTYYSKKEEEYNYILGKRLYQAVNIATIDHVISAFELSSEDDYHILMNLIGSCLILDEIDFYNDYLMQNLQILLKFCKHFNVPVMVMSASLPNSHLKWYKDLGFNVNSITEDLSLINVKKVNINSITEYEIGTFPSVCNKVFNYNKSIIYCNTVRSSQWMYENLKNNTTHKVILYNSLFSPMDRDQKEKEIMNIFSQNSGNQKIILIITQIGEMSLNISCDYMISEMCPIDRLYQRIGRLLRFCNVVGDIDILVPLITDDFFSGGKLKPFPYPYVKGERDVKHRHDANIYYNSTKKYIKRNLNKDLTYGDINKMVNNIYRDGVNMDNVYAKANFETLLDRFMVGIKQIRTKNQSDIDDDGRFSSRGLILTHDVFLKQPSVVVFANKVEFEMFKYKNSLPVPKHYYDKLLLDSVEVTIDGEEEKKIIQVLSNKNIYTYDNGLKII